MFQRVLLSLLFFLKACAFAPWERNYSYSKGRPNLFAVASIEGRPFYKNDLILEIYEERPSCKRFYLGSHYLQNAVQNSMALPIGKEIIIFVVKRSQTFGSAESDDSSVRLRVESNETYRISYRERDGSNETLFQVKNAGGPWHELKGLPDRNCKEIDLVK